MTGRRVWTWPWLIGCTLAKSVLAVAVCLALWGAAPAALGWHPTTVSSGSMLPRLHVGDIAVSRPLHGTTPSLGSVLLFDDPDHPGRLRMHRFVRIDDHGRLVTRGDANQSDDSSPITLAAVRGIGTLRVPYVALPVVWLREGDWLPLALTAAVLAGLALLAAQAGRFGFADDPDEPRDPGDPGNPAQSDRLGPAQDLGRPVQDEDTAVRPVGQLGFRGRSGVRRRGAVLAAAALLGLLGSVPAGAAFTSRTATTGTAAAATYFTCASGVTAGSPYLWYRMDETSSTATTAADSSGGARTGVYGQAGKTAGATRACSRDTGRAMTFDGTSGYLSSPLINSALPNTFTLAIRFKTTTIRGGKLIGFGNSATGVSSAYDRHLYLTNAGKVVFGVYPGRVATITAPSASNDGAWHFAVATLSSAGMRLYLDGSLVASDTTVTTGEAASSGYVRIAYDNLDNWDSTPTSRYFAGTLDDAAYYVTALSATQVRDQYEAGN